MDIADPIPDAPESSMDTANARGDWRVFTDGTTHGTRVYDSNGEIVHNIHALNLSIEATGWATLHLEIMPASITLVGAKPSMTFVCPECSEIHSHECSPPDFADYPTLGGR